MALDTAQKRYSALAITQVWRTPGVYPTGTIDAGERLAIAWLYSGNSIAEIIDPRGPTVALMLNTGVTEGTMLDTGATDGVMLNTGVTEAVII